MKKPELGISVYPQFTSMEDIKAQLNRAAALGYTRVFTSLQLDNLGFKNSRLDLKEYRQLTQYAHSLNYIIHADINREIFEEIGATVDDLSLLKDFGIDVLRLDYGFSEEEIIRLSLNNEGVIIEDNPIDHESVFKRASSIKESGNPNQLRYCHNFFPLDGTGLDFNETESLTEEFNLLGYSCGIFITSQSSPAYLSKHSHGVCTIEDQRYVPSHIAFQELRNTQMYDVIFLGDVYPSLLDLEKVAEVNRHDYCTLEAYLENELPLVQKELILKTLHVNRLDTPAQVVRSTQTRKKVTVEPNRCIARPFLTLTIENELAERYEGEIQIALKDLAPSILANCVGMIKPSCQRLLMQVKCSGIIFKIKE